MRLWGRRVTRLSIQLNHPSAQPSISTPSIPLFIYSSSHLSILAHGQRAMSLCGPDNLDQFPLQFISQPTTHLVKQHQASQGRATQPSKPLPTNHIPFFLLKPQIFCLLRFEVSVKHWTKATFPLSFTVISNTTQQSWFISNVLTLLCLCVLLSSYISIRSSLCCLSRFSFFFSPSLPPSCHGSSVFCCCLVWSDFAQTRLALGKVRSPESVLCSPQVAGTMNTL